MTCLHKIVLVVYDSLQVLKLISASNITLHFSGTNLGQAQQYSVVVRVINKSGKDVVIRSSDNNPKQGWTVKKGYMMDITKGTMSTQPITLIAQDAKGTPLAINNKMNVILTPKATKDQRVSLVISGQGM